MIMVTVIENDLRAYQDVAVERTQNFLCTIDEREC
jgi:hypothetical protein